MIYVANVSSVGLSQKSETKSINFTTRAARSPPFKRPTVTKSDITKDYIPIYLSRASERNGPIR